MLFYILICIRNYHIFLALNILSYECCLTTGCIIFMMISDLNACILSCIHALSLFHPHVSLSLTHPLVPSPSPENNTHKSNFTIVYLTSLPPRKPSLMMAGKGVAIGRGFGAPYLSDGWICYWGQRECPFTPVSPSLTQAVTPHFLFSFVSNFDD